MAWTWARRAASTSTQFKTSGHDYKFFAKQAGAPSKHDQDLERTKTMSTRAIYRFKDETGEYPVYKHYDGYPQGATQAIEDALQYAWPLPRFEAADFGAAFIGASRARNKGGGDTRLAPSGTPDRPLSIDAEYDYEITMSRGGEIHITATDIGEASKIFDGTLAQMKRRYDVRANAWDCVWAGQGSTNC